MWQLNLPEASGVSTTVQLWAPGRPATPEQPFRSQQGSHAELRRPQGGSVENDWRAGEHTPGTECVDSSGDGCEFCRPWVEAVAPVAGLGPGAHRFSLEWGRIESAEGRLAFTLNKPNVLAVIAYMLGKFRAVESLITATMRLWTLLRSVPGDSPVGLTLSMAELKAIDGAKAGGASPQRSPGLDLWMATKRGNKRFAFSVYPAVIM